jgi:hypothetical protein
LHSETLAQKIKTKTTPSKKTPKTKHKQIKTKIKFKADKYQNIKYPDNVSVTRQTHSIPASSPTLLGCSLHLFSAGR